MKSTKTDEKRREGGVEMRKFLIVVLALLLLCMAGCAAENRDNGNSVPKPTKQQQKKLDTYYDIVSALTSYTDTGVLQLTDPESGQALTGQAALQYAYFSLLTLEEIENLEPFRTVVWIETRPWATQRVIEESEVCRFFLLFKAVFQTIGIPIGSDRKHYHFKYTYPNGRTYYHHRVDEFYGREWRVWDKCPTEAQRRETPWLSTK
jgi:hypothetical protein